MLCKHVLRNKRQSTKILWKWKKFTLLQQLHISADSLKPLTKYHMTVISNVYHTSQSLRSSLGGWGWGWDTPPCSARFLPSLSHHVWLGFYFLHFLWYLAPWCIFVHFCSLARVLPISLVTKIVCFPSVNLAATQIRWTLTLGCLSLVRCSMGSILHP